MTESELKRYLIRSIRAQDGVGHRIEDKYAVGWPDCIFIPKDGPVFFTEVKNIKVGVAHLICTDQQDHRLKQLWRPPHAFGVLIVYSKRKAALYIGQHGDALADCRYVPKPSAVDSADWWITDLLYKFWFDTKRKTEYPQRVNPPPEVSPNDTPITSPD